MVINRCQSLKFNRRLVRLVPIRVGGKLSLGQRCYCTMGYSVKKNLRFKLRICVYVYSNAAHSFNFISTYGSHLLCISNAHLGKVYRNLGVSIDVIFPRFFKTE